MEKKNNDGKNEENKNISIQKENSIIFDKENNKNIKEEQENILMKKSSLNSDTISLNNELSEKYINKIKTNPESLFEIIDNKTISIWESKIYSFNIKIIDSDSQIYSTALDRKDQSVIQVDSKRTRYKEKNLIVGFEKVLEIILTFYCNSKKINYKQGINEIFGAFLLMKFKIKDLKLINIVNLGEAFIDKFLANYYFEKDLHSLKLGIYLFSLLLKYHEPNIYYYLDKYSVPHELYVTNWILTFRAQKLPIDIFYYLIDKLINIGDPIFINYILVALIKSKREKLLSSEGKNLVKLLLNLTFNTKEEIDETIKDALDLRKVTPYSYRFLANEIGLYANSNLYENYLNNFELYEPYLIPTMPIFPLEVLHKNFEYTNKIICPDKDCKYNKKNNKVTIDWEKDTTYTQEDNKNYVCEKCNLKIVKNLNYIILDLRLYEPKYFKDEEDCLKMGIISGTVQINKEELLSGDIDKLLSSRLLSIRGDNHIILMTSRTDHFNEFEERFYSDKVSEAKRKKMLLGIEKDEKIEKVLDLKGVENDLDLKELYKLKEYDNFRKILNSMRDRNFPYVSYLKGGFESLHQESLNYNIDLVEHDPSICKLCTHKKKKHKSNKVGKKHLNKNISETLWKNNLISINELNGFLSYKENIILICSLHRFKTKFYNQKLEIFIIFLFDKNFIEIYNKEKELDNKNSNYYNLGVNQQNSKEIILKHFHCILFNEIKGVNLIIKEKNFIDLELKNNEKDKTTKFIGFGFEFYSKEDAKTFVKLIKQIRDSK